MEILVREFYGITRTDEFTIIPLGDIHDGHRGSDTKRLKKVVEFISRDPSLLWVGMGDYCDFIQLSDPRFDPKSLASWLTINALGDVTKAQIEHFTQIIEPIAGQCLGLIQGNHEHAITRYYERDVHGEIVHHLKQAGGFPPETRLNLGTEGWVRLKFFRSEEGEKKNGGINIDLNLHHGFVGGRLAGAKALNMQRWLWNHQCHVAIFGHSHNTMTQAEAVEFLDGEDNLDYSPRIGCYSGTFLRSSGTGYSSYSERKGYFPLPLGGVVIHLTPRATNREQRIRIETHL